MNSATFLALTAISCLATSVFAASSTNVEDRGTTGDWDTLYPRYPACRRGREFATVVPQAERVAGRVYYERVKSDGKIKYYVCHACSVCADRGLATASPCAERTNTKCSQDCVVPGFIFDEVNIKCRAPSSYEDGTRDDIDKSQENSPESAVVTTVLTSRATTTGQRPLVSERRDAVGLGNAPSKTSPRLGRSQSSTSAAPVFSWTASEALFVGTAIIAVVLVLNIGSICYIRHKRKENQRKKREATEVSSEAINMYTALARARTESNVTKGEDPDPTDV